VWLAGADAVAANTQLDFGVAAPRDVLSSLEPRPLFFIHGGRRTTSRRSTTAGGSTTRIAAPREIWIVQGAPHTGAYFADRPLYVEAGRRFSSPDILAWDVSGHLRLVEEEEVS